MWTSAILGVFLNALIVYLIRQVVTNALKAPIRAAKARFAGMIHAKQYRQNAAMGIWMIAKAVIKANLAANRVRIFQNISAVHSVAMHRVNSI
jgi:hypothetical protein